MSFPARHRDGPVFVRPLPMTGQRRRDGNGRYPSTAGQFGRNRNNLDIGQFSFFIGQVRRRCHRSMTTILLIMAALMWPNTIAGPLPASGDTLSSLNFLHTSGRSSFFVSKLSFGWAERESSTRALTQGCARGVSFHLPNSPFHLGYTPGSSTQNDPAKM